MYAQLIRACQVQCARYVLYLRYVARPTAILPLFVEGQRACRREDKLGDLLRDELEL